jgi:predicted amidohydrolase
MDGVLPVARTGIGNLAAVSSEEILYPELLRCLALRGAEVFAHSTSEASSPHLTAKEIARRSRAVENTAFVVSANSAGITGTPLSGDSTNGHSEVVDHLGRSLIRAGAGESLVAAAEVDVPALRRERRRPAMTNLLARVKTGLWAQEYARHDIDRPNGLADRPADRSFFLQRHTDAIARFHESGNLP